MKNEIVYLIEHKETHAWWAGQNEKTDTPIWTNDPIRAWPFENETLAQLRAWVYDLEKLTTITEHEFVYHKGE